jgi:hypothetical protein
MWYFIELIPKLITSLFSDTCILSNAAGDLLNVGVQVRELGCSMVSIMAGRSAAMTRVSLRFPKPLFKLGHDWGLPRPSQLLSNSHHLSLHKLNYSNHLFIKSIKRWPVAAETCKKKTPWSESANELYRQSDRRLLAKWLPSFADRGCHVVSVTDPYGRILDFLDRSRYFSIK